MQKKTRDKTVLLISLSFPQILSIEKSKLTTHSVALTYRFYQDISKDPGTEKKDR